jgi:hypothetical protein
MAKIKKYRKKGTTKYKGMGKNNYMKWVRSHKKV